MDFEITRYEEIDVYNILDILRRSTVSVYPSVRVSEMHDEEMVKNALRYQCLSALTDKVVEERKMLFRELPPARDQDGNLIRSSDPYYDRVKFEGRLTVLSQPDAENIAANITKIVKLVGPRIRLSR